MTETTTDSTQATEEPTAKPSRDKDYQVVLKRRVMETLMVTVSAGSVRKARLKVLAEDYDDAVGWETTDAGPVRVAVVAAVDLRVPASDPV